MKVGESQSNGIQTLSKDNNGLLRTSSIKGVSIPITLCEIQPNVGIFGDYDSGGIADIKILNNAKRETSIVANYNDLSYSVLVGFHSATLTMGTANENVKTISEKYSPPSQRAILDHSPMWPVFSLFLKWNILQSLVPLR